MRLTYTHGALLELVDAVRYYRACRDGLGRQFYHRIETAEVDIINHPEAWQPRRTLLT